MDISILIIKLIYFQDNLTELISHAPYASPTTKLPTHSTESTSEFASSESTSESASSTSGPSSAAPENMADSTSEPFTTPYFNEASMNATTGNSNTILLNRFNNLTREYIDVITDACTNASSLNGPNCPQV